MKVAIVKERRPHERRVAATPDTVKRMVGMGLEPTVESGAGAGAYFADAAYAAAGATIVADAAAALGDADIVLKVQRPLIGGETARLDELELIKRGAALIGLLAAAAEPGRGRGLCRRRDRRLRDGADAAHHPRAGDGRAVVAGQPRRLQGGARRRRRVRPRLPDDDDRGRHDQGGAGPGDGRRRRRAAGDRHRPAPRRDRRAPPMCAPPPRSRSRASAPPSSRSTRRRARRPRRRAATPARWARITSAGSASGSPQALRRTDIVICTALIPGPPRAGAADRATMVAEHGAGLGHRRPRGRGGRQCRGQPAGRDRDDGERRQDHRPRQHAVAHRRRRQPALCPQPAGLPALLVARTGSCRSTPRTRS